MGKAANPDGSIESAATWKACRLTRNVRKHSPEIMEPLLSKALRIHAENSDNSDPIECDRNGLKYMIYRRFPDKYVIPKDESPYDAMKRIIGQNSDNTFKNKIEIVTQISTDRWQLNQAKLKISGLSLVVINTIINDQIPLSQIIDTPYLEGFSIRSIGWDGRVFQQGQTSDERRSPWTGNADDVIEIMLNGTHDYEIIEMPSE